MLKAVFTWFLLFRWPVSYHPASRCCFWFQDRRTVVIVYTTLSSVQISSVDWYLCFRGERVGLGRADFAFHTRREQTADKFVC